MHLCITNKDIELEITKLPTETQQSLSIVFSLHSCQKSIGFKYEGLFLDPQDTPLIYTASGFMTWHGSVVLE